jgi:hypothetical protein
MNNVQKVNNCMNLRVKEENMRHHTRFALFTDMALNSGNFCK